MNLMAMASAAKRCRKPNFSEQECIKLLELVEANADKIIQTGMTQTSNTIKKATWLHISSEVSMLSTVKRDEQECRKKWRDLKGAVTSFIAPRTATEENPSHQEPSFYEWIIKILGDSIQGHVSDPWDNQFSEMQDVSEDVSLVDAKTENPLPHDDRVGSLSPEPQGQPEVQTEQKEEVVPSSSTGYQPRTTRLVHPRTSLISKTFNKARFRRRLAAQSKCESNPKIWDEWLKVQIDYYKCKTELVKEQLLQLRGKQDSE